MIEKILIANRGEIAIRIMKTLEVMQITSVAIYADDDQDSLFVSTADIAVPLEGDTLAETYLNIEQIIQIAKDQGCDAIHPGYGFMSENAKFAQACEAAGITFIGPPVSAIELMGDKVASRNFAEKNGIPLLKGITGSKDELFAKKDELIFPVIIKASAGGGGKGMRVVYEKEGLEAALESTSREALSYFGNGEVFIERYIENPRHIEVQVIADQQGNYLHLFERECTIQRRHQKIIEEASSVSLSPEQRAEITESAVQLAKAANYYSAGTVEFIVDENLNFYFMEMNTRVQVEHPVTELITDVDIVELQVRIAEGQSIGLQQEDIEIDGHAIECRIYAEDPENDFRPSPGQITYYSQPNTEFTRIDTSLNEPKLVSDAYDPMISKVITWGDTRYDAIRHMIEALDEYVIEGIPTNIKFLKAILKDERFLDNDITTNYCKQFTTELLEIELARKKQIPEEIALFAGLTHDLAPLPSPHEGGDHFTSGVSTSTQSVWQDIGFYRQISQIPCSIDEGEEITVGLSQGDNQLTFHVNESYDVELLDITENEIEFTINGEEFFAELHTLSSNRKLVIVEGHNFLITRHDVLDDKKDFSVASQDAASGDSVSSPIPGTVIKVLTEEGAEVKAGEPLIIVEAMKMENSLTSPRDGIVESIAVNQGDKVGAGQLLMQLQVDSL